MINWNNFITTKEDYDLMNQSANRALKSLIVDIDKSDLMMDLDCTFNDTGLDLEKLLNAPDIDFAHDIMGIIRNLNRKTGKIENCFLPRSASGLKEGG